MSGWSTTGWILLILGIILLIIGVIDWSVRKSSEWWTWLLIGGGVVLAIIGIILLVVHSYKCDTRTNTYIMHGVNRDCIPANTHTDTHSYTHSIGSDNVHTDVHMDTHTDTLNVRAGAIPIASTNYIHNYSPGRLVNKDYSLAPQCNRQPTVVPTSIKVSRSCNPVNRQSYTQEIGKCNKNTIVV